jgi:hypothetical protein
MSHAHDPEAESQVESVFDCCGNMRIVFHKDLEDQLKDGINNAKPSDVGANFKEFWLTAAPPNLIDLTVAWNPNVPGKIGSVTVDSKSNGCDFGTVARVDNRLKLRTDLA